MSALPREPSAGLALDDVQALLDRQTAVLELIAGAAPLADVLTEILTSLEDLMGGGRCSVLLLDRERGTLHHGAAPSLPEAYVAAIDGLAVGDGEGSCGTAAATNAPVVAVDVLTDARWPRYRALATDAGLRSCWSTPIDGRDGLPVGTFAVYHPLPHAPSERDQALVDRFTHLASVAIDHARLIEERRPGWRPRPRAAPPRSSPTPSPSCSPPSATRPAPRSRRSSASPSCSAPSTSTRRAAARRSGTSALRPAT